MTVFRETIVAIATPPGRGGIGILRLSGPDALAIASPMLRLAVPLEPNRARFCEIIDSAGLPEDRPAARRQTGSEGQPLPPAKLDEAIATWFAAPHSYTGEHVLEIAAHGSPVLLDFLLRQAVARGARLAEPGEFTERAFLAGRLDLTQAEAVRDLIDAQTLYQARIAAAQLDGALSRRVAPIKRALVQLVAQLEAGIDFAEDDTPTLSPADFVRLATPIAEQLATLARSFEHGRLVHAGLTLAIVGEPNVGKSSLFNRLVERERAIVTDSPGTTRDLVTERIALAGIPVELVDTAGLRDSAPASLLDEAERLGIAKSRQALADADLILLVLDAAALVPRESEQPLAIPAPLLAAPDVAAALPTLLDKRRILVVINKCDLLPGVDSGDAAADLDTPDPGDDVRIHLASLQPSLAHIHPALSQAAIVVVSARTGAGLHQLRHVIAGLLQAPGSGEQGGLLTNLRQHQAVMSAHAAVCAAHAAAGLQTPDEMLVLDLYTALRHLDALTGETTPDDILNLIFSTFCIGK